MEKKLKVGIIGCGSISHSHMASYRNNPHVEVVACCDMNKERAENYAKVYNIPHYFDNVIDVNDQTIDYDKLKQIFKNYLQTRLIQYQNADMVFYFK